MPAEQQGIIDQWELQPGYPDISGEMNNESITIAYVAPWSLVWGNMPEYGAGFSAPEIGITNQFEHLKLVKYNVKNMKGSLTAFIILEYQDPEQSDYDTGNNDEKWSMTSVEVEKPIEKNPNYKVCWNHFLVKKSTSTLNTPSDWEDQTSTEIIAADYAKEWKWLKYGDQVPDGWEAVTQCKKSGVEAYPTFAPEVHHTKLSTSFSKISKTAANDGKRVVPDKTFGKPNSDTNWLQSGTHIDKEGKYWKAETGFRYADKVDEDIYEKGS